MKEKIDRLSNGIFEHEIPELILSEDELHIDIIENDEYTGSFKISNSAGRRMKGLLYVTGKVLSLDCDSFYGTENEIVYHVNGKEVEIGRNYTGYINVISEFKEVQIPFYIQVVPSLCKSSLGPIRDIFQFTNLAMERWEEARSTFVSPFFEKTIILNDSGSSQGKILNMYRQLINSPSMDIALDEFLTFTHKKKKVDFILDTDKLELFSESETYVEKIKITQQQWGYQEIHITTDSPYLRLSRNTVSTSDMINKSVQIEVFVEIPADADGIHYSRICFSNSHKTVVVPVEINCTGNNVDKRKHFVTMKKYELRIEQLYIKYRCGLITEEAYISESDQLTTAMLELIDRTVSSCELPFEIETVIDLEIRLNLYKIFISTIGGKNDVTPVFLAKLRGKIASAEKSGRNVALYETCLAFLEALKNKEASLTSSRLLKINNERSIYEDEWLYVIFLIFLDNKYTDNPALRYDLIKRQVKKGSNSPLLYCEAAALWTTEPLLLNEVTFFECMTMSFLLKNLDVTKEMAIQFAYLCDQNKKDEKVILGILIRLYEMYPTTEVLEVICKKLISLGMRGKEYHFYFKQAVVEQLKVDRLYESYLYTMSSDQGEAIDQSVLLYFSYNDTLPFEQSAILYSYIILNKSKNTSVYRAYSEKIEQFAMEHLRNGDISPELSIIYRDVITEASIDKDIVKTLPDIVFTYRFTTSNMNMQWVGVAHKEEIGEVMYALQPDETGTEKYADILIYTEDASVFCVDEYDNRFVISGNDTLTPLLASEEYIEYCRNCKSISINRHLVLHINEKNCQYNKYDDVLIDVLKQIAHMTGIRKETINKCILVLIDYYYDKYEGELLEAYLAEIDLSVLNKEDRNHVLELMITRDMYDKVIMAVRIYGCEELSAKRMARLCLRGINSVREEQDREDILTMAFFAFEHGRIEKGLLQYLADNYNGTTGNMYKLWLAAKSEELITAPLEERLLAQMLFAESYVEDSYSVFSSYYENGNNRRLIKAYLSFCSYKYFVKDRITGADFFDFLKKGSFAESNQICTLALLKFYSGKMELTEQEKAFCEFYINKFEQKKMVFSFFKNFAGRIELPSNFEDKYYVEYRTAPGRKVVIHYCLDLSGNFKEEIMNDIGYGVYEKEFILFFGENLQYYISEESEKGKEITESISIHYNETDKKVANTRYWKINEILMSKDMQDEKTLLTNLKQYFKEQQIIDECFEQI